MSDPTAFAMAFLSAPVQYPDTAELDLNTHVKTEPDTQMVLLSDDQHTNAYPSSYPGTAETTSQYQLSHHASSLPAAPAVRPPPLNLGQNSNMYRINSVASGPITPCTPYLPLSNLSLQSMQQQSFGTVNSSPMSNGSPMSQPLSGFSCFSSIVSPTFSSPSTYSNASQDVLVGGNFSPSLSTTFSPQLSSALSVTDLGLAPENALALPDDMMDIYKVEPDADLDDHPVGPVVVNTVPSALTTIAPAQLDTSPPLSLPSNTNLKPHNMPSTPPSAKSFYASPPRTHYRNAPPPPPASFQPPPPPKPVSIS